jgi:hypothetical protein
MPTSVENDQRRSVAVAIACCALLGVGASPAASPADPPAPPHVETAEPTLLGTTGLSLNGRIHPHGQPTTYHFEFGPTPAYGSRTVEQSLPPPLAAYYRESWDEGWNGWRSWGAQHLHFAEGGAAGGHIRFQGIERDDHNHDDGIGTVHLAQYMYPGRFTPIPSAYLAAGDPDLRDAIVRIAVRGVDWQPHGTELMWWSQSQSNLEINPDDATLGADYKHSNWAYTGYLLTDLLASGRWERAEYRLANDTRQWSYCGNNAGAARYDAYWPIDQVQRHLNIDLFHMVAFVDPQQRPTGAIDFDEFELTYRNYSLVHAAHGGRLIDAPAGGDDPAALTDGWRHGPGRDWRSAADLAGPLEFTYELSAPVSIEAVQIHQHPQWPGREVEVLASRDGQRWEALMRGELPERVDAGPNYAFLLEREFSDEVREGAFRRVKVRLLSGYRPEHWGLGEIEVFGRGAAHATDDDWCHVNADVLDLAPGAACHYRLVANSAAGTTVGNDRLFTLPADARPHVLTGVASRIGDCAAKIEGRLNPLGSRTEFYFEYGRTAEYGQRTPSQYGGLQITPRLVFAQLTGLEPSVEYHYRLVGVNELGTAYGEDGRFKAK